MSIRILKDSNNTLLMPLTELAETKMRQRLLPIGLQSLQLPRPQTLQGMVSKEFYFSLGSIPPVSDFLEATESEKV